MPRPRAPRHAPPGYVCPFCPIAAGVENDGLLTRQGDVVYRDALTTAFVSSHQDANNRGRVLASPTSFSYNRASRLTRSERPTA